MNDDSKNATPSSSPLVRLEGVSRFFIETGNKVEVLRNVDFEIVSGEFLAITGTSGIGKSTFLNLVGLLDTPNQGKVFFEGEEITKFSDVKLSRIRNHEIGFVFQFHHLLPDFSAEENVLMPRAISGGNRSRDRAKARDILEKMGLKDRLDHLPSELSGGERQRVALARALMNEPRLLLCDEPSGNLDVGNSESLHQLLAELNKTLNVGILTVTHDKHLASQANRRFEMKAGGELIPE